MNLTSELTNNTPPNQFKVTEINLDTKPGKISQLKIILSALPLELILDIYELCIVFIGRDDFFRANSNAYNYDYIVSDVVLRSILTYVLKTDTLTLLDDCFYVSIYRGPSSSFSKLESFIFDNDIQLHKIRLTKSTFDKQFHYARHLLNSSHYRQFECNIPMLQQDLFDPMFAKVTTVPFTLDTFLHYTTQNSWDFVFRLKKLMKNGKLSSLQELNLRLAHSEYFDSELLELIYESETLTTVNIKMTLDSVLISQRNTYR
ncbi:unnamed protein product [Ambrosiozyma monospora]|uniref:Unnamed protein product n=1 Tax=Ambrosiozyma monospora TaxID=43982 RepID=A0ACB5UA51_AMBMO|nr:unnamed protein product [Ambrosiozyma monospora]